MAQTFPIGEEHQNWRRMDKDELKKEYSPSEWSPFFGAEVIIPNYLKVAEEVGEVTRKEISCRRDVTYLPGKSSAKLDVYGEELPKDSPVMVFVHGGYWQELSKDVFTFSVVPAVRSGAVVVVVGYTIAPQGSVVEMVGEIRAALKWALELAKGRGSPCIVPCGWSAGAQLVLQALSTWEQKNEAEGEEEKEEVSAKSKKKEEEKEEKDKDDLATRLINDVVSFSGVFDIRPLVSTYVNDPLKLTKETAWELSPLRTAHALSSFFPDLRILVTAGQFDSAEFKRQSKEYTQTCTNLGLRATYWELPGRDHFNIVENLAKEEDPLTQRILAIAHGKARRE